MSAPAATRRLTAVVCGSGFGRSHLAALDAMPGLFEAVGLLARGSDRSLALAKRAGLPLFISVDDLPPGVDVACVAVQSAALGGAGTEIARCLLGRGIHVLQEKPVHPDEIAGTWRLARRAGLIYQVHDVHPTLPVARRFIAAAGVLLARRRAVYIDAACSVQAAFSLLHVLGEAFGSLRTWRFDPPTPRPGGPFTTLSGVLCSVPLTLRVQNQFDPTDPDNHQHLSHRITIGTDGGGLTMVDTHGPVVWNPRWHVPATVRGGADLSAAAELALRGSTVLGRVESPTHAETIEWLWPAATASRLADLHGAVLREPTRPDRTQFVLTVATAWRDLVERLGPPQVRQPPEPQPMAADELLAAALAVE